MSTYRSLVRWLWKLRWQLKVVAYVLAGRAVMYRVRLEFTDKITFPRPFPFVRECEFTKVDSLSNQAIFPFE